MIDNEPIYGQVVLIIGAGRGLGRDLAEAFSAQGAIVAAYDVTPINVDETMARIQAAGGRGEDYVCDIGTKMPVQTMLNQIEDDWGRLDIVINYAHVNPKGLLLDLDAWDWRRALDVNLTGAFLITQSAGRMMKERGGGIILNVVADYEDKQMAFKAGKMGLLGLTRAVETQFMAYNIRIYALVSEMSGIRAERLEAYSDIVEASLFLCSAEAAHLHGRIVSVLER